MHTLTAVLLSCTIFILCAPAGVHAFGAGDIPDFSYLNDKAFRHGDIEGILENLAKTVAGAASGGGLLGFASSVLSSAKGGEKFGRLDVKRVYFGNWLRDYSQAMDIAGLSKLSAETIVMIISVLGFMTFGFATEEFEVTADRLSVYLPVEHIDNPKGYAEKEGDARQIHPKLRPPVDSRELEIDERTGMKNYMATENEGWDTSTAHIRRTFEACIEYGRRARGREGSDLWEAYRLLGTGLHTMEDLLAHSNWCEIALRKMGHSEVFCHVGDNVVVQTPDGPAPPLITGTFGSADFIHSLMGEATDHISEASVTNLFDKMKQSGNADSSFEGLRAILTKLPVGGGSEKADEAANLKQKAFDFNPDTYAPKEVQDQLLQILRWRDGVFRDIVEKMEMIPGLNDLIDQLTNALNAYIYTLLAPWLTPIMQQVAGALSEGSKAVIDSDDQYEVFNNPNASDPSHSILSKDHFSLILNEPAGKIAQVVVENSVNLIVQAWFNDERPGRVIDEILEAFHHPYYATGRSRIQSTMMDQMQRWFGGLGESEGSEIIQALTKESVREGKNKRSGSDDESGEPGAAPTYTQQRPQTQSSGYGRDTYSGGGHGETTDKSSYSRQDDGEYGTYSQGRQSYGGRQNHPEYSSSAGQYSRRGDEEPYDRAQDTYGGRQSDNDYTSRRSGDTYGQRQEVYRGREESEDYGRSEDSYSRRTETRYGREDTGDGYGGNTRYGREESESYGRSGRLETSSYDSYGGSANRGEGEEYGGRGYHGGRQQEEPEYSREGYQPSYSRTGYGRGGTEYGRSEGYGGETRDYGRDEGYDRRQAPRDEGYGSYGGYGGALRESTGDEGGLGGYGGGGDGRGGGYGGGYDGGRGEYGNDETFGAERLNLEDDGERRRSPGRDEY